MSKKMGDYDWPGLGHVSILLGLAAQSEPHEVGSNSLPRKGQMLLLLEVEDDLLNR